MGMSIENKRIMAQPRAGRKGKNIMRAAGGASE